MINDVTLAANRRALHINQARQAERVERHLRRTAQIGRQHRRVAVNLQRQVGTAARGRIRHRAEQRRDNSPASLSFASRLRSTLVCPADTLTGAEACRRRRLRSREICGPP
jgi:hypothetical protein